MKSLKFIFMLAVVSSPVLINANGIEKPVTGVAQLLDRVKGVQLEQQLINQEREQRFLTANQTQRSLVLEAEQRLEKERRQNDPLVKQLEQNKKNFIVLQESLNQQIAEMGDVYSLLRQYAGDYHALMEDSLISAQFNERAAFFQALTNSDELATVQQINQLWFLLQQEIIESGKVVSFTGELVKPNGEARPGTITRIGNFSALSEGKYLRYLPANQQMLELSRQPSSFTQQQAEAFEKSNSGVLPVLIDPTRGSVINLLVENPSLWERVQQGREVGYIIITLGVIGLLLTLFRMIFHWSLARKVAAQMNNLAVLNNNNPLGRVLSVGQGETHDNLQSLELKLDDAILRELPPLERGQSLIKLFAAVAPLLGLLGTVTGMIGTFQAITLFGTGDPKLMAGGISQALVTTVLGLVVAIPLLFGHNLVSARTKALVQILDEQSAGLLARRLERNR